MDQDNRSEDRGREDRSPPQDTSKRIPFLRHFNERRAFILLIIIYLISSVVIISLPHDVERNGEMVHGTVPDEWAFYDWAEIYLDGRLTVPVDELEGRYGSAYQFTVPTLDSKYLTITSQVSDLDGDGESDDALLLVYDENEEPVEGAQVSLGTIGGTGGTTGSDGTLSLYNIPGGSQIALATFYDPISNTTALGNTVVESLSAVGYYSITAKLEVTPINKSSGSGGTDVQVLVTVTVWDILDQYIEGVQVSIDGRAIGTTDSDGIVETMLNLTPYPEDHQLRATLITEGVETPVASGVVEREGEYHIANHWPPGFSVVLAGFIYLGIESLIGVIIALMAFISTYMLARRLFNWKVAWLSALLVLTSGMALTMTYESYMADYGSTAFAICGMWLFVESTFGEGFPKWQKRFKNSKWLPNLPHILLGISGGMLMAAAVTMRYSTVVVCAAPLLYIFLLLFQSSWKERGRTPSSLSDGKTNGVATIKRLVPTRKAIKKCLRIAVPFILGLIIIGSLLAYYNTILFGGPLNSGYQTTRDIYTISSLNLNTTENSTATLISTPTESFFSQYFGYSQDDIDNIPRIFSQLFYVMPLLFLFPAAVWVGRKRLITYPWVVWIAGILIIYCSMSWVGRVPLEDVRYFLPIVPPAAITVGFALYHILKDCSKRRFLTIAGLVSLLIIGNLMAADYAVSFQLDRIERGAAGPIDRPPQQVGFPESISIQDLFDDPAKFDGDTVFIRAVTVESQVDDKNLWVTGDGTDDRLLVRIERPIDLQFRTGERLDVMGLYRTRTTESADIQSPEGLLIIREGADDFIGPAKEDGPPIDGIDNRPPPMATRAQGPSEPLQWRELIINPPSDKPIPPSFVKFVVVTLGDTEPDRVSIRVGEAGWVKCQPLADPNDPESLVWIGELDLTDMSGKVVVEALAVYGDTEETATREYTVEKLDQPVKRPIGPKEMESETFNPKELFPARLFILLAIVGLHALLIYNWLKMKKKDEKEKKAPASSTTDEVLWDDGEVETVERIP